MNANEAIKYIESTGWSRTRLGLSRERELLSALGEPQKKLRFVHVAGTNGKGSTCAMLDSILRQAGYRTGLYTSPYIEDFCERIKVNGESIPLEALAKLCERVANFADEMADHPSQFELITAIAMQYFFEQECDIVVLEVGMGGEHDATNVIDTPELAVITNIGLEHTEYLGDTIEKIALTKCGIIKPNCRCVRYDGEAEVNAIIEEVCRKQEAKLYAASFKALRSVRVSLSGQSFVYKGRRCETPLLGEHQTKNAAVAIECVEQLRLAGWKISDKAIARGLANVKWPARFEILGDFPIFVLDGGHNPQCAEALVAGLNQLFPDMKCIFLMGILADKNYPAMLDTLMPFASHAICLSPKNPRALSAEELAVQVRARGIPAHSCEDVAEGIGRAIELAGGEGVVVCFGSLYLAGAVRTHYATALRGYIRRRAKSARAAIEPRRRSELSSIITARICAMDSFISAKTVMLYCATPCEVSVTQLERLCADKRLVYPVCQSNGELVAVLPDGGFERNHLGIYEPVYDSRTIVPPEEIDLIVCPCVSFDGRLGRLGMGAGYYDRFLPKCTNAVKIAVAFEAQKYALIPLTELDIKMDAVVTEDGVYGAESYQETGKASGKSGGI